MKPHFVVAALLALAGTANAQGPVQQVRPGDTLRIVVPAGRAGDTLRLTWQGPNDFRYRYALAGLFRLASQPIDTPPHEPPAPTPPRAPAAWASDWSRGDVQDGGRWETRIGNGRLSHVVPVGDSLDFPTAQALAVVAGYRAGGGAAAENPRTTRLPALEVGGTRYYRWYIRVVVPDRYTGDNQTHPIQDGTNGSQTNWMQRVTAGSGTWDLGWSVPAPWPDNIWTCAGLAKGRTYRVELALHRPTSGTVALDSRVHDSQGRLVCGRDDFRNVQGATTFAHRATSPIRNPATLNSLQVGFNGLNVGGPSDFPFVLYYQGALCVRTDDWCGPYVPGETGQR